MQSKTPAVKVRPEDLFRPSDNHLSIVGDVYSDFYKFDNHRSGQFRQLQHHTLIDFWKKSRELFWTSMLTESEDLKELDLQFAFPFVRKEVLDFLGRITSLNMNLMISGDGLSRYGVTVLQAMHKKWRLKNVDRVEKFWQSLYGVVNGTVAMHVGFDNAVSQKRFLREYDGSTGDYRIETKDMKMWNDVTVNIIPIEEMYLEKIWQRNIQKQGKVIRKQEMTQGEFDALFPKSKYPNAQFVVPGTRIAEDSLYFRLLGGSGIITSDKIQVLTLTDVQSDKQIQVASGIALDLLGTGKKVVARPMPFDHKRQPYVWSVHEPIDEKFAYGLSMPFKLKDPHKLLNSSYTMLVEQELRAIDTPYLTSDIEAPQIIFGQKRVIPVMDVEAYKPVEVKEASSAFYTMMNSLQGVMSSQAQGGSAAIAPSKQPRAAREIIALENMKQQALGNALVLYFDMCYQEVMLFLKTALQFYQSGKYANQSENLLRTITVPSFPMTQGGTGQLEVRIVKEPANAMKLYFEAIQKSIENGKTTEIIEIPVEMLNNLEFFIDDIRLEPESASELEKQAWNESVFKPLVEVFIPSGVADLGKTFMRWAEKNGEHIANFASGQALPNLMNSWQSQYRLPPEMMGRKNTPKGMGNVLQSTTGSMFGSQSNGGYGAEMEMPA